LFKRILRRAYEDEKNIEIMKYESKEMSLMRRRATAIEQGRILTLITSPAHQISAELLS
jgi:hypothetical protein